VLHGDPVAEEIHLPRGNFRVGRARGCYIKPMCAYTSRRHCLLNVTDELVAVQDVGSRNGTIVNGRRIDGTVRLRTGDVLQVGLIRFMVVVDEHAPVEPEPRDPAFAASVERLSESEVQSPADSAFPATTSGPHLLTVEQLRGGSLGDSYIVRWLQGQAPDSRAEGDGSGSTLNAPVSRIDATDADDERDGLALPVAMIVADRREAKRAIEKTQDDTSRAAAALLRQMAAAPDMDPDLAR
jgi:pSer/pThr/pTyr-binding forkhead associated (FHA) protein